ncbi:2OG-Fe(II) oxygenase family protein [Ceratobasidium sp. AG-Ba]|nr:2OG-Fe(II) oxygenase family protein [Ceratobasidium sp. AG-Ba]
MPDYSTPRVLPEYMVGDHLTPDPEDRKHTKAFDNQSTNTRGWNTEIRKQCRDALDKALILEDFSFAVHQRYVDDNGLPKIGGPPSRPGPSISLHEDQPCVVAGWDELVGVFYIPRFVHAVSLSNFTAHTNAHAKFQFPKPPPLKRVYRPVKCWHSTDIKQFDIGFWLCLHYGLWHPTGHGVCCCFGPTRDMTNNWTNEQWSSRIQFLDAMHPVDGRANYFTWLTRPDFYDVLAAACPLYKTHPSFAPFDHVWHSLFPGRALLVNQESGQHLDQQGVRRAWDVLIAAGDFEGGEVFFADVNLFVPFLPGDMIAFDGTALRHEVRPFSGKRRISHVYFVHRSVLDQLGIPAKFDDVYLADLRARIESFDRPLPVYGPALPPGFRPSRRKRDNDDQVERPAKRSKRAKSGKCSKTVKSA